MEPKTYNSPGSRPVAGHGVACAVAVGALAASGALLLSASQAGAASITDLNSQIASAQSQAQSMAADVDAKAAQVAAAHQQAVAAAQREAQLSAVLAQGEQRAAELETRVEQTQARLAKARAQLHGALRRSLRSPRRHLSGRRARRDRAAFERQGLRRPREPRGARRRGSRTRTHRSPPACESSATRWRRSWPRSSRRRPRRIAFNQRVAAARDQIASVRANAEAQAAQLEQARQQRGGGRCPASSRRSPGWEQQVTQLQQAQAQQSQQAAAAQAQQTVSSWVGHWAIPQAIVMCESGGNFSAVNSSSGAGGAYQILPSTWQLYGGSGAPQDASPQRAEPDRLADLGRLRAERLGLRPVVLSEAGNSPSGPVGLTRPSSSMSLALRGRAGTARGRIDEASHARSTVKSGTCKFYAVCLMLSADEDRPLTEGAFHGRKEFMGYRGH